MPILPHHEHLLVLCAIRDGDRSPDWSLLARQAAQPGGLDDLYLGVVYERQNDAARNTHAILQANLDKLGDARQRVVAELAAADEVGARLITVLDDDYPLNLRRIVNLPPFLFVRGELRPDDARSVAVVGTRKATDAGIRRAQRMAGALVDAGVTVVSGLAAGIDTAAHAAALDRGGRTIAVLGTGITKCYPGTNRDLAERIAGGGGALVSQFWPTSSPATWTFPRRNVVTSGISQGTVVIEASATSGAKMQARLALEHGKKVWLIRTLVTEQPWAQRYLERGAIEVEEPSDVVDRLQPVERIAGQAQSGRQLSFGVF